MALIDLYPETLRDLYDKLHDTLEEAGLKFERADLPLATTEWIRKHWSGRTLIPRWWGTFQLGDVTDPNNASLPGVSVDQDQVKTIRGRELRAAVWSIVAGHRAPGSCHIATAIAARVEAEWSRNQLYIAKSEAVDRYTRDLQIWQDFSGLSTVDRVIEKHGLTQDAIYKITRRIQKDKDHLEQPTLF